MELSSRKPVPPPPWSPAQAAPSGIGPRLWPGCAGAGKREPAIWGWGCEAWAARGPGGGAGCSSACPHLHAHPSRCGLETCGLRGRKWLSGAQGERASVRRGASGAPLPQLGAQAGRVPQILASGERPLRRWAAARPAMFSKARAAQEVPRGRAAWRGPALTPQGLLPPSWGTAPFASLLLGRRPQTSVFTTRPLFPCS